jgi:glutathione-specific gamma-glutamylcyclotransferase
MASLARSDGDLALAPADGGLFVFAYGSLTWNPGFEFKTRRKAVVLGWSRRLCIYSHVYRGTADRPGLVLGLDRGGMCEGVVFHVDERHRERTIVYLRNRELVTGVYIEEQIRATLEDGAACVSALAYLADRRHPQYVAAMSRDRVLELVRQGVGLRGANAEYVLNTRDHLYELGIRDPELEWLAAELRAE